MTRIPKDLLARLEYFHVEVDQLFQRLFGADLGVGLEHDETMPCLDLLENDDELIVRIDLPGVKREAVELHAGPNFIVIKGEKIQPELQLECLRVERSFGKFQRMIPLPSTADAGGVRAKMAHGVLEAHIPKLKDRRKSRRRIPIK